MQVSDFNYHLPEELIAQSPLPRREASRLLVINREKGLVEHKKFLDFPGLLNPGDVLILNDTKVRPARLLGQLSCGRTGEVLLLNQLDHHRWEVLVRPGKRLKKGAQIEFGEGLLTGEIVDITPEGQRIIQFGYQGIFSQILAQLGQVPLPPYIKEKLEDPQRYQTVYAREEGSAAAPTAGLHFTSQVLEDIEARGVNIGYITLHVGIGTFRPVKTATVEEHQMHGEYYDLPQKTADMVNHCEESGGRVISVGTTVARTLETVGKDMKAQRGWTDIFIYPGYEWKVVDGLLTNFHLPQSTLLMLVSSLAGKDLIMDAYKQAVAQKYRFFSFGDACYIF